MNGKSNKVHLPVTKDLNGWYKFSKGKYRVQFSGDTTKGGFWLDQYAKRLGKDTFMKDFLVILAAIEHDNEIRKKEGLYPIGIFNLYVNEDK